MHGCRHRWRLRPPRRETRSRASSPTSSHPSATTIPIPSSPLSNTSPSLTCQFHFPLSILNFNYLLFFSLFIFSPKSLLICRFLTISSLFSFLCYFDFWCSVFAVGLNSDKSSIDFPFVCFLFWFSSHI